MAANNRRAWTKISSKVCDCGNRATARRNPPLCPTCYSQWRRKGGIARIVCRAEDCLRYVSCDGLCAAHYEYERRHGTLERVPKRQKIRLTASLPKDLADDLRKLREPRETISGIMLQGIILEIARRKALRNKPALIRNAEQPTKVA